MWGHPKGFWSCLQGPLTWILLFTLYGGALLISFLQWPLWGPMPVGWGIVRRWGGWQVFAVSINWPESHDFGPLLSDTHHLLEMALNYSTLDLSKIGTLKWRSEKRRLDLPHPAPEILNARKIELFELMKCLKQWGVSPFVLALQN